MPRAAQDSQTPLNEGNNGTAIQQTPGDVDFQYMKNPPDKCNEELDELTLVRNIKNKLNNQLKAIEEQVTNIYECQAKSRPDNFYQQMRTTILNDCNLVQEIYGSNKDYDGVTTKMRKALFLKMDKTLYKELSEWCI